MTNYEKRSQNNGYSLGLMTTQFWKNEKKFTSCWFAGWAYTHLDWQKLQSVCSTKSLLDVVWFITSENFSLHSILIRLPGLIKIMIFLNW